MDAEELKKKYNFKVVENIDHNQTVLVVDSQQDLRMIVSHHITKRQYRNVKGLASGLDTLSFMRGKPDVSLIVCSMDMPMMSGLDLLSELREDVDVDRPPFCLTMANVSKERIMLGVESGVDEILVKPFTLGDILPKMQMAFKKFHNPKNPEKIYELAKQSLRNNDLAKAEEVYKDLAEVSKTAARPLVGLARTSLLKGDMDAAFSFLNQAEKINPQYVHLYAQRALLYVKQSNWSEAIKNYSKAIDLSPLNPNRYISAVEALVKVKRFEDVVTLLKKAIAYELDFPDIYHYLSHAYFQLRDFKNAILYVKKAIQVKPDNLVYLNQLAIAYKESGQKDEAMKTYNQVIKADPDNLVALFNKAILLENLSKMDEAKKIYERVVRKHPDFQAAKDKLKSM